MLNPDADHYDRVKIILFSKTEVKFRHLNTSSLMWQTIYLDYSCTLYKGISIIEWCKTEKLFFFRASDHIAWCQVCQRTDGPASCLIYLLRGFLQLIWNIKYISIHSSNIGIFPKTIGAVLDFWESVQLLHENVRERSLYRHSWDISQWYFDDWILSMHSWNKHKIEGFFDSRQMHLSTKPILLKDLCNAQPSLCSLS